MYAHDVVLIGGLVDRCPSLLAALQEHLDAYEGFLPHVFMGDVTRWAAQRYLSSPSDPELISALAYLESAFEAGRDDDRELIIGSFLENLPTEPGRADGLRQLLGPALRRHLGHEPGDTVVD